MITIDRKKLDTVINEMNLYPEAKQAIQEYHKEKAILDERGRLLNEQLSEVQKKHLQNLMKQEGADVSELIYLKKQGIELVSEMSLIEVLKEELQEEHGQLKVKHYHLFQKALSKDSATRGNKYDMTPVVDNLMAEMIVAMADLGKVYLNQYNEIAPDIREVFDDPTVREYHPRSEYAFSPEANKPSYSLFDKYVLKKYDVQTALTGVIPEGFKHKIRKESERNAV